MRISELMLLHWFDRKTGRSFSVLVIGFSPVSYTHLDVYKRQDLYCEDNGRPSVDPVVLFKIVLIQHI